LKKEAFDLEKSIKKIKDSGLDIELLRRENEKLCEKNTKEIGKLMVVIMKEEIILQSELKKSGEDKLECKLGSVSFKKMPDEWKYQDEILMAWIISLPTRLKNLYLKVTTTIKKAELKKRIMLDNSTIILNSKLTEKAVELIIIDEDFEDPEFSHKVEGIEIESQEPKFSYTIKNLKK